MRRVPEWLIVTVAVVLFVFRLDACHQQEQGALKQKIKAREDVIAALVTRAQPVETLEVKRWFAKWDTLYDTLYDTLDLSDTMRVKRLLFTADSTIQSCRSFFTDCVTQLANRDTTIIQQDSLIRDLEKRKPSWFGCVVGGTASDRGIRPGVACGFRVK